MRRQHLESELQRRGFPLVAGQYVDFFGLFGQHVTCRVAKNHADSPGALLVDLQHRGRVELQVDISKDGRFVRCEVEKYLLRSAVRSIGTHNVDFDDRASQVATGVVDGDVIDDRDPAVGHRVAEVGNRMDLDAWRVSRRFRRRWGCWY